MKSPFQEVKEELQTLSDMTYEYLTALQDSAVDEYDLMDSVKRSRSILNKFNPGDFHEES